MFDIGEHEGERFLTMEFVEGQMLSARIDTGPNGVGRPLASALLIPVSQQICAGLSAAHAVGVIHREVCPIDGRSLRFTSSSLQHRSCDQHCLQPRLKAHIPQRQNSQ